MTILTTDMVLLLTSAVAQKRLADLRQTVEGHWEQEKINKSRGIKTSQLEIINLFLIP
jgi:hypothetical protein